ncbi:MAG TPA: pectin acetylesterase-family hydrolase [Labilithrix sp.]|nr:pectin acetylesterase-family hydrolase [Labilithrix sp.]
MSTLPRFFAVCCALLFACSSSPEASDAMGDQTDPVDQSPTEQAPSAPAAPASETGTEVSKPPDPNAIVVPKENLEKWVWVPIPSMRCSDDTPSGVGVNFTDKSRDLMIFFMGNGACFNQVSCSGVSSLLGGMGDDPLNHMWWENPAIGENFVFARNDANNPFRNTNFVVLPHCTVDGHSADKDSLYLGVGRVHQHGYRNVTEALKRVVPTFRDATRIVAMGYSAGGIGVMTNYHQIATAFEGIGKPSPFLINDSGPILRRPYLSAIGEKSLIHGWALDKTLGSFCPKCMTDGLASVTETLLTLHPGMRSAVLSSYQDEVATLLYRVINIDVNVFDDERLKRGLLDLEADLSKKQGTFGKSVHRSYFFPGTAHGAIFGEPRPFKGDLATFVNAQLSGDATWKSYLK